MVFLKYVRQKMRSLSKNIYIRLHIKLAYLLYRRLLLKTDKKIFAAIFNLKSWLFRNSVRLSWDGTHFNVTDKGYSWFSYKIRHRKQCNMAYEGGLLRRAENLAKSYFLTEIAFSNEDIFLDCGANVGDVKLWFNLKGINIEYQAFEPSPVEFSSLKQNVYPSKAHNVGLWNEPGELKFYVSSEGADSSLIEPPTYDEIVTAKVRRLEDFVNTTVKCLKLEAEGAEPEILDGLGEKIKLIEYVAADLGYERGIKAESTFIPVNNILIKNGFELVKIDHRSVRTLYRNKSFQNKMKKNSAD